MRIPKPSSTTAVLLLAGALFVSASGGAVAGSLVTSKQIKDGTIAVKDLSPKTVKALKGTAGPAGPAGAPGANGTNGTPGLVRAYGLVNAQGNTVTRQSGGITVTTLSPGNVCLSVPGVNSQLSPAVITMDYTQDNTTGTNQGYGEVLSNSGGCPNSGDFRVYTFHRNAASGESTAAGQGFFFLVP